MDELLKQFQHFSQELRDNQITLFVPSGGNYYEEELEVRGYDPIKFNIEELSKEPFRKYNCKTRLMLQYETGTRIAIIDQSTDCNLPFHNVLSSYSHNKKEYELIEISTGKEMIVHMPRKLGQLNNEFKSQRCR